MPATVVNHLRCPVYLPDHPSFTSEIAGFNTAVTHTPAVVVVPESAADIATTIRFARDRGLRVAVQSTGHGSETPITSELLISTRHMTDIRIDPITRIATLGAGVQWGAVVTAAAEHGLAPIAGSSPDVGVVGYLLGGGLGPFARSHGFSSDYLVGCTVVTGDGEILDVSADHHRELFWALRGGKTRLGIVTEIRVRLAEMPTLYAGSLFFDEPDIATAFRAWTAWTNTAHPLVTTSVAIIRFPEFGAVPAPFRGRRLLNLRFAYPGALDEGAQLAAPLRAAAPVYFDALGALPPAEVARIHNDPRDPCASWVRGMLLRQIDEDFVSTLLTHVGAGTDIPLVAVELRHLGNATHQDVDSGSAVGGRNSAFTLGLIGVPDPKLFESVLPQVAARILESVQPWSSGEMNINFLSGSRSVDQLRRAWPGTMFDRLAAVRTWYDGRGVLG